MIFNEMIQGLDEKLAMESANEKVMTLEEEMNAEIADLVAMESATDELDASNIFAFVDGVEATNAYLAMRDAGLSTSEGRDVAAIYKGFGIESEIAMEAAKDVLARKAYAGKAAIKALIATLIKWLKALFGVTVASKKVFESLAKKAKAMKTQLEKKKSSEKVTDKLSKEVRVDFVEEITKWVGLYDEHIKNVVTNITTDEKGDISAIELKIKSIKDTFKTPEGGAVAPTKEKKEGAELVSHLITSLDTLSGVNNRTTADAGKAIKDAIAKLEKVKKSVDAKLENEKDETKKAALSTSKEVLNAKIKLVNEVNSACKKDLKGLVKVADELLTVSKGVLATIY